MVRFPRVEGGSEGGGVAVEIDRRLAATRAPGSPNGFTAAEVRDLALEYLGEKDEELRQIPHIAGEPHWNLWSNDDWLEDAIFVVLLFRPGGVEFLCGRGDAGAIRDFDSDTEQLAADVAAQFVVSGPSLHLTREVAETWLGRGW